MVPAVLHNPTNTKKLAFDAPFFNQRVSGYNERFTFTGKERDEETGYGYFGARYMDYELMTSWISVDPMADKYPSISPYAFCVRLTDPDEMTRKDIDGIQILCRNLLSACGFNFKGPGSSAREQCKNIFPIGNAPSWFHNAKLSEVNNIIGYKEGTKKFRK